MSPPFYDQSPGVKYSDRKKLEVKRRKKQPSQEIVTPDFEKMVTIQITPKLHIQVLPKFAAKARDRFISRLILRDRSKYGYLKGDSHYLQ